MNSLNENKYLIKENIENYKDKLLSSYWTEINLIGYKIELLEKRKVEYLKELESKIIDIGNKISEVNEGDLRNCFNCEAKQTKQWDKYLKEQFLCHVCGVYIRNIGKLRPKEMLLKTKKIALQDRNCSICTVSDTSQWHRYSKPGHYLCAACYNKLQRIKKLIKNTKEDG
uniref:GATA-type domain-containing protein n=1 Tax=Meloidogyne enterolobii TaxID=390850 RepID=A0A6V7UPK1_MELEN|nr:unnamed protein product [Meloidogyne enterolobii]